MACCVYCRATVSTLTAQQLNQLCASADTSFMFIDASHIGLLLSTAAYDASVRLLRMHCSHKPPATRMIDIRLRATLSEHKTIKHHLRGRAACDAEISAFHGRNIISCTCLSWRPV